MTSTTIDRRDTTFQSDEDAGNDADRSPHAGDAVLMDRLRALGMHVRDTTWHKDATASFVIEAPGPCCTSEPEVLAQVFVDAKERSARECKGERYAVWTTAYDGLVPDIDDGVPALLTDDADAVVAVLIDLQHYAPAPF